MGRFDVEPQSERQTREWFTAHLDEFDYDIIESQAAFPDYLLLDADGSKVRCEAEYESANFVAHSHNPLECDLVVCWIHSADLSVPVLELSTKELHATGKGACKVARKAHGKKRVVKASVFSEKTMTACQSEVDAFLEALVEDMKAYDEVMKAIRAPRLALLDAQNVLVCALEDRGGKRALSQYGDGLHPYNLFTLLHGSTKDRSQVMKRVYEEVPLSIKPSMLNYIIRRLMSRVGVNP